MKQEDDRLRSLFQEMEINAPSKKFEDRLMLQIQKKASEQIEKKTLRSNIFTWFSVAAGFASMIVVPLFIMYLIGWKPNFDLSVFIIKMPYINPFIVLITVSILLLIIADTLIRKHIFDKKHKDEH